MRFLSFFKFHTYQTKPIFQLLYQFASYFSRSQGCFNKVPLTGGLKGNLFSHKSGGQIGEIKATIGLVSSQALCLAGIQPSSLCVFTWSSLCVCVSVLIISSYKSMDHIALGPILMTSLHLTYLFEDLIFKYKYLQISLQSEIPGIKTSIYDDTK